MMTKSNNSVLQDYKNSPLGMIPSGWKIKRLAEITSFFRSGNGITARDISDEGMYPVYGGNGLRGYTNTFTHEGEYFLIGRQGALCGNIVMVSGRSYVSEHAIAVQTDKENNNLFLAYKLEFLNLNRLSESSAQPGLSVEKLLKLKVSIPDLKTQKAIAARIMTWDNAIRHLACLIEQKEIREKWYMQQLLTGRKRLRGFTIRWKEGHLGDFFDERIETDYPTLPLLSIGQSGVYPQSESEKRDISNSDKSKYRRICIGDIGYNTMRMWQGRSALSNLEGIVSPAYTILKPNKHAHSLFFSYLFKMPKLINAFFRNSQGLVEDTLNCKYRDFAIIKVHLPEKAEQVAIANVISDSKREIEMLRIKLDLIKEQRRGLMQMLLTGKKQLKN